MRFWLSGEVMADVAEAYREVRKEVEGHLTSRLADASYGPGIDRLVFVAVISSLGGEWFPELRKYHRKEKDAEFRLRIDHAAFLVADERMRRVMVCEALSRAIGLISTLPVNGFDTDRFLRDFGLAVAERGWREDQG